MVFSVFWGWWWLKWRGLSTVTTAGCLGITTAWLWGGELGDDGIVPLALLIRGGDPKNKGEQVRWRLECKAAPA